LILSSPTGTFGRKPVFFFRPSDRYSDSQPDAARGHPSRLLLLLLPASDVGAPPVR